MIRKPCDNCDRIIEVSDGLAGQKVACAACGDVNLIPAHAVEGGRSHHPREGHHDDSRTERLGIPPDRGPEQNVLKVRPAMARARPLVFTGLLVALAAGAAGLIWGLTGAPSGAKTAAWIAGALLALAAVVALAIWKINTLAAALEVSNKRSVYRRGLFSRATSEVLHDNIRNVQVTQSFWQRLWGVGKLGLSSSGQEGIEIEMRDVPNPERVREIIDAYRPLG